MLDPKAKLGSIAAATTCDRPKRSNQALDFAFSPAIDQAALRDFAMPTAGLSATNTFPPAAALFAGLRRGR